VNGYQLGPEENEHGVNEVVLRGLNISLPESSLPAFMILSHT
jgi:hypothetical protein